MGTYNLPRNVKGEGRILFIFSTKALIYTTVGASIGLLFYFLTGLINMQIIGIIILIILALLGFAIGTLKMPNTNAFEITKKTGGENLDDILKRLFRFKMKKNRIYVYEKSNKNIINENEGGTNDE